MKRRNTKPGLIAVLATLISILSCGKETASNNGAHIFRNFMDTVCRTWEVYDALKDGAADGPSLGITFDVRADSTFTISKPFYEGIWEFAPDYKSIIIAKNVPAYKTIWEIKKISSKQLHVNFKSPVDGSDRFWKMASK